MAMSVLERTREIGLLRAVGLTRGQSRRMIRGESVMIAVLGGILGVASGLIIGIALQRALAEVGIGVLSIPLWQIALFLVGAGMVGDPRRPGTCPASGPDGRPGCRRGDLTRGRRGHGPSQTELGYHPERDVTLMKDVLRQLVQVARLTPTTGSQRFSYACGALLVLSGMFHGVVQLVAGGPWDGPSRGASPRCSASPSASPWSRWPGS